MEAAFQQMAPVRPNEPIRLVTMTNHLHVEPDIHTGFTWWLFPTNQATFDKMPSPLTTIRSVCSQTECDWRLLIYIEMAQPTILFSIKMSFIDFALANGADGADGVDEVDSRKRKFLKEKRQSHVCSHDMFGVDECRCVVCLVWESLGQRLKTKLFDGSHQIQSNCGLHQDIVISTTVAIPDNINGFWWLSCSKNILRSFWVGH